MYCVTAVVAVNDDDDSSMNAVPDVRVDDVGAVSRPVQPGSGTA
jgi:hypothetical protein